jgi:hypothetical protein
MECEGGCSMNCTVSCNAAAADCIGCSLDSVLKLAISQQQGVNQCTVQREVVEGTAAKLEAEGWQAYLDKMKTSKSEKKHSDK